MTGQEASELLFKVYGEEVFKGGRSNGKTLTTAILMGANALKVLEQIRWERDIALAQLEELGLSLGQKIDGVYLTHDRHNELLEYAYRYESLCK